MTDTNLIRRLAAAQHAKDRDLSDCLRWTYGTPTPGVIRLARGSTTDEFCLNATVAHAFAVFHAGRAHVAYGGKTTSIGTALRTLGVGNNRANRLLDALLTAGTAAQLHAAIMQIIRAIKPAYTDKPWQCPNWEMLHRDLHAWNDPAQRDTVRLHWGHDFTTFTTN